MAKIPDLQHLLDQTTIIINRDIKMEAAIQKGKNLTKYKILSAETANKLTKYATTVRSLIEYGRTKKRKTQALTDDQLKAAAIEILNINKEVKTDT